jgi:hypothetical protein
MDSGAYGELKTICGVHDLSILAGDGICIFSELSNFPTSWLFLLVFLSCSSLSFVHI